MEEFLLGTKIYSLERDFSYWMKKLNVKPSGTTCFCSHCRNIKRKQHWQVVRTAFIACRSAAAAEPVKKTNRLYRQPEFSSYSGWFAGTPPAVARPLDDETTKVSEVHGETSARLTATNPSATWMGSEVTGNRILIIWRVVWQRDIQFQRGDMIVVDKGSGHWLKMQTRTTFIPWGRY